MERVNITQLDDKQIDELLAYTPGFGEENSASIDRMFREKIAAKPLRRSVAKRFLLAAAAVAATLAVSITALAATGVIDFSVYWGRVSDSIFDNPEASPYLNADGIVIAGVGVDAPGSGGILTVEPVAVLISQGDWDRYFFDLYISLKLTAESKLELPAEHELYIHQKHTNEYGPGDVWLNGYGFTDIKYIDEYSATVSFRTHAFADNVIFDKKAGTLTFNIHAFSPEWNLYSYPEFGDDGGDLIWRDEEYPVLEGVRYYGDWEITIYTNAVPAVETLYVDGSFDGNEATVRLNATGINVRAEGTSPTGGWKYDPDSGFRITLSDGRVIESLYVENMTDSMSAEYWSVVEFYNPADVVRIELFDEVVWEK